MGEAIAAKCKCGFGVSAHDRTGSVNQDADEDSDEELPFFFPHLCEQCRDLVQLQINLGVERKCPRCKTTSVIPYDDPLLSERVVRTVEDERREFRNKRFTEKSLATDRNYKCPRCGQMALRFEYGLRCED